MSTLKIGDQLYRVYDGIGNLEVQAVTVKRITPEYVWFSDSKDDRRSGGLAFDCRTRLELKYAEECARTPQEAIDEFLAHKEEAAVKMQQEIKKARRWAVSKNATRVE